MADFNRFIKDNHLRKIDVAKYLGISPSNISAYCKGAKIPEVQLAKLRSNTQWKCDSLVAFPSNENPQALLEEIALLRKMVENQAVELHILRNVVEKVYGKG